MITKVVCTLKCVLYEPRWRMTSAVILQLKHCAGRPCTCPHHLHNVIRPEHMICTRYYKQLVWRLANVNDHIRGRQWLRFVTMNQGQSKHTLRTPTLALYSNKSKLHTTAGQRNPDQSSHKLICLTVHKQSPCGQL